VEARATEVRALIMTRNELAQWMARDRSAPAKDVEVEDAFLPETLDRPSDCKRCFSADACMLYRRVGVIISKQNNLTPGCGRHPRTRR
jgi:DNA replication ATP-dependent helicase Dna2